jgi:hypothetical protein
MSPSRGHDRARRWEGVTSLMPYAAVGVPVMSWQVCNRGVIAWRDARAGRRCRLGRTCEAMACATALKGEALGGCRRASQSREWSPSPVSRRACRRRLAPLWHTLPVVGPAWRVRPRDAGRVAGAAWRSVADGLRTPTDRHGCEAQEAPPMGEHAAVTRAPEPAWASGRQASVRPLLF